MLTVACVLKTGGDYDAEYVERLHAGVTEHLPLEHRFVCLTDVDGALPCETIRLRFGWQGWWAKMQVCHPNITGDVLYIDLDTIITGDLTDIASVGKLTMLDGFYDARKKRGTGERPIAGTGLMYLREVDRAAVWWRWMEGPSGNMRKHRGDQEFIDPILGVHAARWATEVPGQVRSYKLHVKRSKGLGNARVVCFHGKPRPRDIGWKVP